MLQEDGHKEWSTFLRRYYKEEVERLHLEYPERDFININYGDIHKFDRRKAESLLTDPEETLERLHHALVNYDSTIDVRVSNASPRVVGFPEDLILTPAELTKRHTGTYVAIRGIIDRVTMKDELPTNLVFECLRCGMLIEVPQQQFGDLQEPTQCRGCERQGPFQTLLDESEFDDYCKLRLDHPPDSAQNLNGATIEGHVTGNLVNHYGEYGLVEKAGENAVVYGIIKRKQKRNEKLYERVLEVKAVEFDTEDDTVDIAAHKEEFTELAERDDAVDLFKQSIVPELYQTKEWETALEWAVAYLFGAPRIDIPNGPTYRGDIHGAIISDFGMGKSMFSTGLTDFSPKIIRRSATGLSSDVGLTAAAVQDDFGEGQWTIKPGILVRANGGHVILDEIDKGPSDLKKINDAIEGEQLVNVDKAGLSATFNSKVGLLVLGNPKEGRFDNFSTVASQIGVDQSTLSRFDGIITMKDNANEEIDGSIANRSLKALSEAQSIQYEDDGEIEVLKRPVEPEVGKAWIQYARENIFPRFHERHIPKIKEWYASEVRRLNLKFNNKEGEGGDMPVPASPRVVMWVARFSTAFARCHLREQVTDADVERALALARRLVSQRWDGDKFIPQESDGIRIRVMRAMERNEWYYPEAVAREIKENESTVMETMKKMSEHGELLTEAGKYQIV